MNIINHLKQNKYFFLLFFVWLIFNPLFLVIGVFYYKGIEHFTEIEQLGIGLYFIIWTIYGILVLIRSVIIGYNEAKKRFTPKKETTIDQIINEMWEEYYKEKDKEKENEHNR